MITWIGQPGDYSGDTWHLAAAMTLSDSISLVQTVYERKDLKLMQQSRAFYKDIGISDPRLLKVQLGSDLKCGLRLREAKDRLEYNCRNIRAAYDALKKRGHVETNICYVYQATAMYLREVCRKRLSPEALRGAFTESLLKEYPDAISAIENRVREIPSEAVLIIGRYAPYLKEYDADRAKIRKIVELAHRCGRPCCLIADSSLPVARKLATEFSITLIDPYKLHQDIDNVCGTGRVDMRGTAYFWTCLAQKGRQEVVVGGRSGSVDIAAYLGLRVAEWDSFNPDDPESLRLASMSPLMCSTIDISRDTGFDHNSRYLVGPSCYTNGTEMELSAGAALEYALKGQRVAVIHKSRMKRYVEV